jgi:hypothetical protein
MPSPCGGVAVPLQAQGTVMMPGFTSPKAKGASGEACTHLVSVVVMFAPKSTDVLSFCM